MTHHPSLMGGRWHTLSFAEQMGNIGSEVHRTHQWQERGDAARRDAAMSRALELLDATIADQRWSAARKEELLRVREGFLSLVQGDNIQQWTPQAQEEYFDRFAVVARTQAS